MLKLWDKIIGFVDQLSAAVLICLILFVSVQVILRYILRVSVGWGPEFASLLLIWIVFLGSIVLVRQEGHLAIGTLTDHLSPKWNTLRKLIINLAILAFLVMLFFQSIALFRIFATNLSQSMRIPLGVFFAAVLLFAAISGIEYGRQIFCLFKELLATNVRPDRDALR